MDLSACSVAELLRLHAATLAELRDRRIVRTANAPAGDLAELLVVRTTGGELADNAQKSWDVFVGEGEGVRLQVKARLVDDMKDNAKRQLSPIRTWDFDFLIAVLFDEHYVVRQAARVHVDAVKDAATWRTHVNGWVVFANQGLLRHGEDWTAKLRAVVL